MFEKFRKSLSQKPKDSKFSVKNVTAYVIFGAIILVFALFGITPDRMGSDLGGTAAVVNGETISMASFSRRVDMIERSTNLRLDQFPQAQRELFTKELRRRALEEMIATEALYQSSKKIGVLISDEEVRKTITSIPVFQDKDRFQRERYESYLSATAQNPGQFEREIRKDLVTRRMQELFLNSNKLAQTTLDGVKSLDQIEVSFKYASLDRSELIKSFNPPASEVDQFLKEKTSEVQADYERRKVEFQTQEQVQAKHILIKTSPQVSKDQAKRKALDIKKELTVKNFGDLAKKYSEDEGSKSQGGDLGFFTRGRMVPEFEKAAFAMAPGAISEPVESEFGYHIILVEKKDPGGLKDLKAVERDIARTLIAKGKVDGLLTELKGKIQSKDVNSAKALLSQLNAKWQAVENIGLGADFVSGLSHPEEALKVIAKQKGQTGFIPAWNEWGGRVFVMDLTKWVSKTSAAPADKRQGSFEERVAGEAFEKWIVSLNEAMKVERNARILQ